MLKYKLSYRGCYWKHKWAIPFCFNIYSEGWNSPMVNFMIGPFDFWIHHKDAGLKLFIE